ncbi:MAG: acyl-CoA thioesterase [Bacteroidetes bacterium]|nr:acyl-CoA thioesterase [Bacteroidota bacterium]
MGNQYKTIAESEVTIVELMLPSHSNFRGKIHGGYLLSLMDSVAFACAAKHSGHYCVTASVETVDFLNPVEVGDMVSMKASINYVGKSSMVIGIRVESEDIQTGKLKHCNSSYFTMVARDEEGNSIEVPGLHLQNPDEVRRFLRSVQRAEEKKRRRKKFNELEFILEDAVKEIAPYRVQLHL